MCSISGVVRSKLKSEESATAVDRMNLALRHRGPDDVGKVTVAAKGDTDFEVILGNTRLAILDVSSAGHQPMQDPETGNWITYNGEVYNFRQLRREIGNEFGPWRSNTDTEVVLRAYRKWGTDAFGKLRGMFALAIWDDLKQELFLARDQFGIKPLYYYTDFARTFLFASEVRALLASELVPRRLDSAALNSYLEFGAVEAPSTIVDKITALLPGELVSIRLSNPSNFQLNVAKYSKRENDLRPSSREHAKAQLRTILEDSVEQHLVSDVPVGVFLSGGMDSSAIVGLMRRVSKKTPKTFSVVFAENQFNEASHSRLVAKKFNTDHCEIELSETSLLGSLPDAISALDQPTMDGINSYVVSKAVKQAGIKVALSGLGGDELFGGYPSFRRALKFQSTSLIAKGVLKAVAPIGRAAGSGSTRRNKFWQFAQSDGSPRSVCRITRQLFAPEMVAKLNTFKAANGLDQATQMSLNGHDTFNAITRLELEGYMANTLLRDTDSMSMAHSLEVRVPFVDAEVASFVLNLPGEWKSGAKNPKPLLAEVIADLLPADFLKRKKMGFTLPFEKWMVGELRDELSMTLHDAELLNNAGLDREAAQQVWRKFCGSPKDIGWSRPWALFVLAKWCELNNVKA